MGGVVQDLLILPLTDPHSKIVWNRAGLASVKDNKQQKRLPTQEAAFDRFSTRSSYLGLLKNAGSTVGLNVIFVSLAVIVPGMPGAVMSLVNGTMMPSTSL